VRWKYYKRRQLCSRSVLYLPIQFEDLSLAAARNQIENSDSHSSLLFSHQLPLIVDKILHRQRENCWRWQEEKFVNTPTSATPKVFSPFLIFSSSFSIGRCCCLKFSFSVDFDYWVCVNFADKKWGKGKDKIDDEDITFQRMVAKVSALVHHPFCFYMCGR